MAEKTQIQTRSKPEMTQKEFLLALFQIHRDEIIRLLREGANPTDPEDLRKTAKVIALFRAGLWKYATMGYGMSSAELMELGWTPKDMKPTWARADPGGVPAVEAEFTAPSGAWLKAELTLKHPSDLPKEVFFRVREEAERELTELKATAYDKLVEALKECREALKELRRECGEEDEDQ